MNMEKVCYQEQSSSDTKKWTAHVSRLNSPMKKVLVAVPHQESKGFTVKIYNHNDELVYLEDHSQENDFAKVYHLKGFDGGAVFHVTDNSSGETKIYRAE